MEYVCVCVSVLSHKFIAMMGASNVEDETAIPFRPYHPRSASEASTATELMTQARHTSDHGNEVRSTLWVADPDQERRR